MKHYIKYVWKGFRQNLSRFIAVIAIVALGVGVLVGLLSSPGDLHASIHESYLEHNMYDINLKSTLGFHTDTIEELEGDDCIIQAASLAEGKATWNHKSIYARRISRKIENVELNTLTLLEGRVPKGELECVVLYDNTVYAKPSISDTLVFEGETYEIVGIVSSAEFFAKEQEYNLTATGRLDLIFYVEQEYQINEMITDVYIKYKNLSKANCFEDAYFDELRSYEQKLKLKEEKGLALQNEFIYDEIHTTVSTAVKEELLKQYPIEVVDGMMESDMVKSQIEFKANESLQQIIDKNGYEWHILNLKSNLGFMSFQQNVDKINKIAIVFPVFFFFIAALVSLTTITRLVEEERTSIGLLKSLGYSKAKISYKYILYGLVCSILGSIIGSLLGIFILPAVIHIAFGTLYDMPKCVFQFNVACNLISSGLIILTIVFVALYVALKSLRERPCQLLLPKAPRPGRRILIEKIPFLWKRIKFKHKNMLRNIFRYKKNLMMMIIGVGGCVMLLLCAFGIQDVVGSIGSKQYDEILQYDLKISLVENTRIDVDSYEGVESYTYIRTEDVNFKDDVDYDIVKINAKENISDFISLRSTSNKEISLTTGNVIITKQLADKFKLKIGSTFTLEGDSKEYTVSNIAINYIGNYMYCIEDVVISNGCFINTIDEETKENILTELSTLDNIRSIEVKSQSASSYKSMADSLTLIVLVIILCSGALAVIVIYNLTNININERIKEIATLKVLGYQSHEVCGYIYREIFLMSILGILAGFILGPLLFGFITHNLQSPGLIFSSDLNPLFFLYSFIITIVFVCIVDILFIPKIKKIQMVESLKCVD